MIMFGMIVELFVFALSIGLFLSVVLFFFAFIFFSMLFSFLREKVG